MQLLFTTFILDQTSNFSSSCNSLSNDTIEEANKPQNPWFSNYRPCTRSIRITWELVKMQIIGPQPDLLNENSRSKSQLSSLTGPLWESDACWNLRTTEVEATDEKTGNCNTRQGVHAAMGKYKEFGSIRKRSLMQVCTSGTAKHKANKGVDICLCLMIFYFLSLMTWHTVYILIYVCIHVCKHIWVCVYTFTHRCACTHTHTHKYTHSKRIN